VLAVLSFLAPLPTAPVLVASFMLAYVAEGWVHHSVRFVSVYGLKGPYWWYITRHHQYHHSPRGSELAFGLTNGFWDLVFGTRIPARDRRPPVRKALSPAVECTRRSASARDGPPCHRSLYWAA
jgi:sterol desaturase/sphingolipid hydroxylase (fatty acid hydroxylase superfamily)